mmetsp:Transcript_22745/g.33910  ORF Transcript_22745/g.33910 Transcript_22745/m.33910 type:complete len:264 (-) Transcript_22745:336-1127(-)
MSSHRQGRGRRRGTAKPTRIVPKVTSRALLKPKGPPKPHIAFKDRQKRLFVSPGPGSYKIPSPRSKRSTAFGKAGRMLAFEHRVSSPGPKYNPRPKTVHNSSPSNKFSSGKRFRMDKLDCQEAGYLGHKTLEKRSISRKGALSKQKRFLVLKAQHSASPGPIYKPSAPNMRKSASSSFGKFTSNRFKISGQPSKNFGYVGHTSTMMKRKYSKKGSFPTAQRKSNFRGKLDTPAAKYSPKPQALSRMPSSPSYGFGYRTMPRFM